MYSSPNITQMCFSCIYVRRLAGERTCSIRTNGLPEDEHIMFETCRSQQELNYNINLKIAQFVDLRHIIGS